MREIRKTKCVEKAIARVRRKYGIRGREFTRADFYRICEGEGIYLINPELYKDPEREKDALRAFWPIRGFYAVNGDRLKTIYLRCFWQKRFNRFVAFHELGHHFLKHHDKPQKFFHDSFLADDRAEQAADYFSILATSKEAQNAND